MSNSGKDSSARGEKNEIIGGTLYLVATPVGNLADLSPRAVKVLSEVDFIAAEDTRNTGLLLSRFGISKPQLSYHEHNKRERGEEIAARLEAGEACALVSDAGTPAISDPGEALVKLCAERGITVTAIPGCCAAINALVLSGMRTDRFVFEGFLPTDKKEKKQRLSDIAAERRTVIIYEAPHKLRETLAALLTYVGDRKLALCREMTKLNEEIMRTSVSLAIEYYESHEPRGEYVLVLEGNREAPAADYPADVYEHVAALMETGLGKMDAIKAAAKQRGEAKSEVYRVVVERENNG